MQLHDCFHLLNHISSSSYARVVLVFFSLSVVTDGHVQESTYVVSSSTAVSAMTLDLLRRRARVLKP